MSESKAYEVEAWALNRQVGPGKNKKQPVSAVVKKLVLVALAIRSNADGYSYYGQTAMCTWAQCNERTIREALKSLEADGLIARKRRFKPNGDRTSDHCMVLFREGLEWPDDGTLAHAAEGESEAPPASDEAPPASEGHQRQVSAPHHRQVDPSPPASEEVTTGKSEPDQRQVVAGEETEETPEEEAPVHETTREASEDQPSGRLEYREGESTTDFLRRISGAKPSAPVTDDRSSFEVAEDDSNADLRAKKLQHQYADLMVEYELDDPQYRQRNVRREDYLQGMMYLLFEFPGIADNLRGAFEAAVLAAVAEKDEGDDRLWMELSGSSSPTYFLAWLHDNPQALKAPAESAPAKSMTLDEARKLVGA